MDYTLVINKLRQMCPSLKDAKAEVQTNTKWWTGSEGVFILLDDDNMSPCGDYETSKEDGFRYFIEADDRDNPLWDRFRANNRMCVDDIEYIDVTDKIEFTDSTIVFDDGGNRVSFPTNTELIDSLLA